MLQSNEKEVSLSLSELDHILALQRTICSLIASDTPYLDVITETCRMAEQLLPGAVASFMRLDRHTEMMSVVSARIFHPKASAAWMG